MAEITFKTSGGNDAAAFVAKLAKGMKPTQEDLLYAGQRQRTRILERTSRGVDVDEHPFKPYSDKGPYYYNPNGRLSASARRDIPEKSQKSATRRFLNKITTKEERGNDGAPRLSRTGRTIRFESYAAFKKWLGRAVVDLRGSKAPHMLQAIVMKGRGPREVVLGIYGEAAARGQGHNEGNDAMRLPKRRFFDFSKSDVKAIIRDVQARIRARIRG